jgi:2-iminobutanoate/2-iminopropanoate deaminase
MSSWTRVIAPGLPEFPAFAHAAIAGDLEDDFSRMVAGGIGPETTQSLRHVERILGECGASLADVVKVSVYMTDLGEWEEMNRAYLDVFGAHTPARIAVGCASLLFGAKVEFDCIAHRG